MIRKNSLINWAIVALGTFFNALADFNVLENNLFWRWFGLFFVILGIILEFIYHWPSPINNSRESIEAILDGINICFSELTGKEIRIAVFVLNKSFHRNKTIGIVFGTKNLISENPADRNVNFEKFQGLVGQVWGNSKISIADLTLVQQDGYASWNLAPEQIAVTKNLKAIYAAPIIDIKTKKMLGILSVDSNSEFTKSNTRMVDFFASDSFQRLMGATLGIISYIFNDNGYNRLLN